MIAAHLNTPLGKLIVESEQPTIGAIELASSPVLEFVRFCFVLFFSHRYTPESPSP